MSTLLTCLSSSQSTDKTNTNPNSTALIIPATPSQKAITLSHNQLLGQVYTFQSKLAGLGITPGKSIAIALPNTIEFAITFLATSCQRAICAPLNPAYKVDEFEFYLDDLKAALILLPSGAVQQNGEAVQAARNCGVPVMEVKWNGTEVVIDTVGQEGVQIQGGFKVETPEEDDVALILHTSGTTGRPKAVPLTHKNLFRTTQNIQQTYQLTAQDRTMLVMPLFHVHGLLAGFLAPLGSGGSIIIPPKFSAAEFWRDFVTHEATWYTAVPTIHQILLKSPLPSPVPKIRFVRSCSSPLAPTVLDELERVLAAPVLEAYAMTEAAHQMTSNPLPPAQHKAGSVGMPQGTSICIKNDAGHDLAVGETGEICVSGTNVTAGYLGTGIESPFTTDGYFRTGDQGYLDADGYLFLTGRIKELINKGGEKISPIEIDNLLTQHVKVAEAVSFAIDDEIYGQNVAVAIVVKPGNEMDKDELLTWFEKRAARFKVPKKVFFTTSMPKTATGKVQRRQVAKAMEELEAAEKLAMPEIPEVSIPMEEEEEEVKMSQWISLTWLEKAIKINQPVN